MEKKNFDSGMKKLDEEIKKLQKIKSTIKKIDSLDKKSFIHVSLKEINMDELINTNNTNNSWLESNIYYNPKGMWISCGSSWYKWLISLQSYHTDWTKFNYIYKIYIDKSNVLYIKKLDKLIEFHNKYSIYKNDNYHIDWKKVKKDYDGLIICPYLGYKIWGKDPTNTFINKGQEDYILKIIGKNIKKYPPFFLEWYRHWETGSGVIWRKSGIKKIELIK